MKVLFINANCGVGSTGRICTDLYSLLKNMGQEAKIAYATTPIKGCDVTDTYKIHSQIDYYIHNILAKFTDRTGFFSQIATKKLIKYIENENPDIIHLHNIHGYYINIEILFNFLKNYNKPVVWTLHDCWAFTGHCAHYSYHKCYKWMTECNHCTQLNSYPKSFGYDNSRKNYIDKKKLFTNIKNLIITTPSYWLANEVKKSFLNKYRVLPIYNGIDLSVFKYTYSDLKIELGISENKKILLGVSFVWSEKKGLYDMLKLDKFLDHNKYQLILIGLSSEQIKKIPKTIIGIGRTNSIEELVKFYSIADVFINTSYEETMGLVTVEALACGTPAIVYDQTAVPEIIDESSGVIVRAGNVEAIVEQLENVMRINRDKPRERATNFEIEQQYSKYYNLYTQILSQ